MAKVIVLKALTGQKIGTSYSLPGRGAVIGSSSGCDLVLHDRLIEPRHAEFRHMLDSWFIVPLSPTSGISVNGTIIRGQSRVRIGDRLTLGSTTFSFGVEELIEREVGGAPSTLGVPRLGQYLQERGILTAEQVRRTAERQAALQRTGVSKQFGEVAYELGYLNRSQLERVLADQRSDFNLRWRD